MKQVVSSSLYIFLIAQFGLVFLLFFLFIFFKVVVYAYRQEQTMDWIACSLMYSVSTGDCIQGHIVGFLSRESIVKSLHM